MKYRVHPHDFTVTFRVSFIAEPLTLPLYEEIPPNALANCMMGRYQELIDFMPDQYAHDLAAMPHQYMDEVLKCWLKHSRAIRSQQAKIDQQFEALTSTLAAS